MSPELKLSDDLVVVPLAPLPLGGAADRDYSRGRAQGYAAGYAAGLRQAERELAAELADRRSRETAAAAAAAESLAIALAALESASDQADARIAPVLADVDTSVVAAGIEIAEALIGAVLTDPGVAATAALHRGLAAGIATPPRTIRMHPLDIATLAAKARTPENVELVPDIALEPGDAVVVYDDHELDGRIATALERARRAIDEATS